MDSVQQQHRRCIRISSRPEEMEKNLAVAKTSRSFFGDILHLISASFTVT